MSDIRNIGSRRELFWDDTLIDTHQTTSSFLLHHPERKPPCCPPPNINGFNWMPFRTTNAPTAAGPPIFRDETASKSIPAERHGIGNLPKLCAASTSNLPPPAASIRLRTDNRSCTVPLSLFAWQTHTRLFFANRFSGNWIRPSPPTAINRQRPHASAGRNMAG